MNSEPSKSIILRLQLFEAVLTRNVAKFGAMSPYIELIWNEERWKSKPSQHSHLKPCWNECHTFESQDPAPLHLIIKHNSFLFTCHEIGSTQISTEELFQGKSKEWVELFHEGQISGKVLINVNMYEEKRSELSTHNTSYASIDLIEEYHRKLNDLELEKEELEFYKKKYKRKVEKLNQEKRNYRAKVSEIIRMTTPKHTEESSQEEAEECGTYGVLIQNNEEILTDDAILIRENKALKHENEGLSEMREQIELDLARLRRGKQRTCMKRKTVGKSQGKLSDLTKFMDLTRLPHINKSASGEKLSAVNNRNMSDWQEIEDIKFQMRSQAEFKNQDELELKFEISSAFNSPKKQVIL